MKLFTLFQRKRKGFTLIELLTVIAIIGILAGILIPTIGAAMTAAKKAKGRNQMRQYALAIGQYKSEYGYYPPVGNLATSSTNPTATLSSNNGSRDFIMAMSGRQPDGDALTSTERNRLNPKAIGFSSFSEQEFYVNPNTGEYDIEQLADPFNNRNIIIKTDTKDYRGVVRNLGISSTNNRTTTDYNTVRMPVVVYTLFTRGDAESVNNGYESLLSWE